MKDSRMGNLLATPDMVIYISRHLPMVDLVHLREVSKEVKNTLDGKPLLWELAAIRNFEMGIKWAAVYNHPDVVIKLIGMVLSTPDVKQGIGQNLGSALSLRERGKDWYQICDRLEVVKLLDDCIKWAAVYDRLVVVEYIVNLILELEEAKKEGLKLALPLLDTGIQWAAERGHFNLVEYFLSQGARKTLGLNGAVKGWLGKKAPSESYKEIIDSISKKHPNFDIIGLVAVKAHCTPHNRTILEYLLEKGATPNAALDGREHEDSALHHTTVELLLEKGADPRIGLRRVSLLKDPTVVNLLLEKGANPEELVSWWSVSKNQEHVELLQKAVELKKTRAAESLLPGCCIF